MEQESLVFDVKFEKACPLCEQSCPNLRIEETNCIWINDQKYVKYGCSNREICKSNWERFKALKNC